MNARFADRVTHHPPTAVLPRMLRCMWRQASRTAVCPETPRLDGKLALVTGGSRGIGLATSRGLAARGAEVISAARRQPAENGAAHFAPLDLADLRAIRGAIERVQGIAGGRPLDVLVANAGLWPTRHALSAQGHEIAFATNVLGHHALVRGLLERGLLAPGARVVIVTGDIYVMARACSADYRYRGARGGQMAYCRSKLGNVWYARELARRHPELRAHVVHPGVVATALGGRTARIAAVKRALMLSPEQGAQTSLFCATWPGLESGTYFHNTLGRVELRSDDPGADAAKAAALWELVQRLV